MRLVFVHVDAVTLSRGELALDDPDGPDGRGVAASEGAALASTSLGSALVAFATVETGDGTAADAVRATAARAVRERAADLRVDDVVLVPTALASDRAATPAAAAAVWEGFPAAVRTDDMAAAGSGIEDPATAGSGIEDLATTTAGFGWDYGIEVATKAHPFATAARTVRPGDADLHETAEGDEGGGGPSRRVVLPDGTARAPQAILGSAAADERHLDEGLERALRAVVPTVADPARTTSARSGEAPPDRGDRARRLGVADRDPLAAGARRRPVGEFLRDALSAAVATIARQREPTPSTIGGPRALDLDDDAVRAYAATLGDRGHGVAVDDALPDALGAATALATFADADATESDAPAKLFDRAAPAPAPTRESTRGLTTGDVAPTIHEAHASDAGARDAVAAHAAAALDLARGCELAAVPVVTVAPAFDDANADWVDGLAAALDAPALVVVDDDAPPAWPLQLEVVVATPEGGAFATGLVRLDDDGFRHFAGDGDRVPSVVHAAPAGGLDATVAAICDTGTGPNAGDAAPVLPDWLAPTQVRLVPVADDHVPRADAIADALEAAGVRVDVDDRDRAVGARLAAAERERVPRYVVVGDDERPDDPLPVTDVATGRERALDVDALANDARNAAAGRLAADDAPPRPFPRRRSNRLAFATDESP